MSMFAGLQGAAQGMDIGAVRRLAETMTAKASEIESIASQLEGTMGQTQWAGPDANQFTSDWQSTSRAAVNALKQQLEHNAQVLRTNADQQEQTGGH